MHARRMEQIVTLLVCLSMIFGVVRVGSVPASSDIISGREFLSILMKPTGPKAQPASTSVTAQRQQQQQPRSFRGLRKFQHFFYDQPEDDESVLPIEALFSSLEDMDISSSRFYDSRRGQRQMPRRTGSSTSDGTTVAPVDRTDAWLLDDNGATDSTTLPSTAWATEDVESTATSTETMEHFADANGNESSSSSTRRPPAGSAGAEGEVPQTDTATEASFDELPLSAETEQTSEAPLAKSSARFSKRAKAIYTFDGYDPGTLLQPRHSNAHRSELAVEELDPTVSKEAQGMRERMSFTAPKPVATPPADAHDAPVTGPVGQSLSYETAQFTPGASQQRYRTQRKQDSKGPFQSVVYHEKKDAQKPASVSYSYLGDTVPTGKTWRDIGDEYLPARKESASIATAPAALEMQVATGGRDSLPEAKALRSAPQRERSLLRSGSSSSSSPPQVYSEPARFYSEPAQFYSEPAKVYSEPARIYGEPEKVYSQPARVYSEPAKVYSEPAKVYSEPAKVYSEPAKIYSQPSSYWQTAYSMADATMTTTATTTPTTTTSAPADADERSTALPITTTLAAQSQEQQRQRLVFNELDKIPYDQLNAPTVDGDSDSIHNAIGKFVPKQSHAPGGGGGGGEQTAQGLTWKLPTEASSADPYGAQGKDDKEQAQTLARVPGSSDDSKVGYVVEGRNYRKYRVEEKTPDGFIVGEYGVLSHNDGNLRGVRYTADSDINPRLIYDALLKFLSL